jgi:hypothetical protein
MNGSLPSDGLPRTYLMFDGTTNYVEIADNPAFSLATTGALTVSVLMMPQVLSFPTSFKGYVHWLGKGMGAGASGRQEWAFRMYDQTNDADRPNRISFYVFNPEGHLGIGSYYEDPQDPVVAGQWMHFAGVADNGTIRLFKNGADTGHCFQYQGDGPCRHQLDNAGQPIVIVPIAGSAPLCIGTQDGKTYFQGGLAGLRIWNRALSPTEIGDLVQSGQVPPDGLVAQYMLDEGAGTTVADTSGSGAGSGTIVGATWATT